MNKDISFDKDLNFNTRVSDITTISLEDDLHVNELENEIEGNLYVSGKYKILDASTILEDFSFSVPCTISILDDVEPSSIKYSISNFTYEIIDNNVLRCHINMNITGDSLVRECDDDIVPDELKEIPTRDRTAEKNEILDYKADDTNKVNDNKEEKQEENAKDNGNMVDANSLFANLEDNGFTTYHVYIMREGDTIEKVIEKYKSNKEALSLYNDLSNIKVNSKVIVPSNE